MTSRSATTLRGVLTSLAALLVWPVFAPAAPAAAQCVGDCSLDREVTVDEIVVGVNIALGSREISECRAFDLTGDGTVTVDELVRAIRFALDGCPALPTETATTLPSLTPTAAASPTPSETATVLPTHTPEPTRTPTISPTEPVATPTVVATSTATVPPATPTATATATATAGSGAVCGNGFLEPGETCAGCAADCQISACTASGTRKFTVHYSGSRDASSLSILVGYRSDRVSLPGNANQATVGQRVTERPSGTFIVNDLNYALRTVMGGTNQKPAGKLYTIEFDLCRNAPAPTTDDFGCTVEGCSDSFGPIPGCVCSIENP